jgi:hypothetical protein
MCSVEDILDEFGNNAANLKKTMSEAIGKENESMRICTLIWSRSSFNESVSGVLSKNGKKVSIGLM